MKTKELEAMTSAELQMELLRRAIGRTETAVERAQLTAFVLTKKLARQEAELQRQRIKTGKF